MQGICSWLPANFGLMASAMLQPGLLPIQCWKQAWMISAARRASEDEQHLLSSITFVLLLLLLLLALLFRLMPGYQWKVLLTCCSWR
jgi:hypothetical protein